MGDEIFEEIQQTQANLTEKQRDKVREVASSAEANEDPHFLLLGRPAVGKSTFAGALTEGKFKGSSGPTSGTKSSDIPGLWKHIKTVKIEEASSTKSDGSNSKKVYCVSDTVGLGDVKVDLDEMKREAKEACKQSGHCTVFLCIALEDRLDSNDTQIAFDVCNSLDMWENVVVVITKCDLVSPEIADAIGIEKMKNGWKKGIENQLESMNVDDEVITRIINDIVFSCHPKRISIVDQSWPITLLKALKGIIQRVGGAAYSAGISIGHNLLGEKLFASCIQPADVDYEVQDVTQPNQNIEEEELSPPQPERRGGATGLEQSGLKKLQEKGCSQITKAVIGGAIGGVGGAVGGAVVGGLVGAAIGGAAAVGGAAIFGALTGGVGLLIAGALIAFFLI